MDYTELLALRLNLEKLAKFYALTDPDDDVFSGNLLAAATLAHHANRHYLDRLLARTLELKKERDDDATSQRSLFEVSRTEPANQEAMRAVAEGFLLMNNLGVGVVAPVAPEEDLELVPSAQAVLDLWGGAQPERTLPPVELISTWTDGDRETAYTWAQATLGGFDNPPPVVIAIRYMEDLSFDDPRDRIVLCSWVGFTVVEDVDWSLDLWREVWDWTRAYHLCERLQHSEDNQGFDPEVVPPMPRILVPQQNVYGQIKAFIAQSPGTSSCAKVTDEIDGHGVKLAVLALLATAEITLRPDYQLRVDSSRLDVTTPDKLEATLESIGRREITVTLFEDGSLDVTGVEAEVTAEVAG